MLRLVSWAEILHSLQSAVEKPADRTRDGEGSESETDDDGGFRSPPGRHEPEKVEDEDEEEDEDTDDDFADLDDDVAEEDEGDEEMAKAGGVLLRAESPELPASPASPGPSAVDDQYPMVRPIRGPATPLLELFGCLGDGCCEGRRGRRGFRSDPGRRDDEMMGHSSPRMMHARSEPLSWDRAGEDRRVVALGRYAYDLADVIGRGGFSTVRKGVDLVTGRPVAIKTYSAMEERTGEEESSRVECDSNGQGSGLRRQFQDEVRSLLMLHQASPPRYTSPDRVQRRLDFDDGDEDDDSAPATPRNEEDDEDGAGVGSSAAQRRAAAFDDLPPSSELFVQMLDFSREGDWKAQSIQSLQRRGDLGRRAPSGGRHAPGPAADGCCYLVLELASETLTDFLRGLPAPLCKRDVRHIFRQVCEVVAGLHCLGYVHLDIKPDNLMRFPSGRFKLIDMDGILRSGSNVPVSDVISTAKYCSPEFAKAFLDDDIEDGIMLEVCTPLDVFSLGLVGAELVSRRHPLEESWRQFMGGSRNDEQGFYRFLTAPGLTVRPPPEARAVSPLLEDLLACMLRTRTRSRATMHEVLAHPFFAENFVQVATFPPTPGASMAMLSVAGDAVHRASAGSRREHWTPGRLVAAAD